MKLELIHLLFKNQPISLVLEEFTPSLEYQGKAYSSLTSFTQDFPEIVAPPYHVLAAISNFFAAGVAYTLIEDISAYKKNYEKIGADEENSDEEQSSIGAYGDYDLSEMREARLENQIFTYYVESVNFGIPYRAICILPSEGKGEGFFYETLPHKI